MTLDEKSTKEDEMASNRNNNNEDTEGAMTTLEQYDVLLGRGIGPNEHPGNIRYRTIVQTFQDEYLATNKRKEKEKIAKKAIDMVKANGARFLRQVVDATSPVDGEDKKPMRLARKRYTVAEADIVLEKTKQSLRFQGHKNKFPNATGGSNDNSNDAKKGTAKVASDEVLSTAGSSTGPLHSSNPLLGAALRSGPPSSASSGTTPMGSMVGGASPAMAASQDMLLKALLSTLPNYSQQQQQQQHLSSQQDILGKVSALFGGAPAPRASTPTSSTSQMDLLLQNIMRQNNSSPSTLDAHNLMATLQKLSKPAAQPVPQQQPTSLSLPQLQQLLSSGNLQMQNNLASRGDMASQLMNLLQSQQQQQQPQPPAPAPVPTPSNGFLPAASLSTFGQDPSSLLQLFAAANSPGASEALRAMLR